MIMMLTGRLSLSSHRIQDAHKRTFSQYWKIHYDDVVVALLSAEYSTFHEKKQNKNKSKSIEKNTTNEYIYASPTMDESEKKRSKIVYSISARPSVDDFVVVYIHSFI